MNHEEFYSSLSDDLKAKIKACTSQDEMMDALKAANIELDAALLEDVSGGKLCPFHGTPKCVCDIKIAQENLRVAGSQAGCRLKCPPHLRDDSNSCPPYLRDGSNSCPPYLRQG